MNLFVCALMCCFTFSVPEVELVSEINLHREAAGVAALQFCPEAARLARNRVEEMVKLGFFGHESLLYGTPDDMLVRFGVPFSAAGVNIAKGQESAAEAAEAWFASPAHRENLLNADFTSAGVGLAFCKESALPYWAIILISPLS